MDVIEAEHGLQGAADLFDVPRELMGDAEQAARINRLRREARERELHAEASGRGRNEA